MFIPDDIIAILIDEQIALERGLFVVCRDAGLEYGMGRLHVSIAMIAGNDDGFAVGVVGSRIHVFPPKIV